MVDPLAKIKQKLLEEIDQLSHELNVDLPKEIAVARAHGDLSENAEYKYAKERQGFVNARIGQLKKRLGDLGMLNLTNIPKDRAGYGSRLTVLDTQKDVKIEYKLVSTEEADAEAEGSKKPADGVEDVEIEEVEGGDDDSTFIEETEEEDTDVTEIIGGDLPNEEET